ncbi:hypothetical protein C477_19624 [Haloterrigena salina JCM 13891]|uniref:DUF8173 domain-containing protein n=1 Tax=Haloterrigena salina JCM 13891 TaxID=1227488 RepID=M0BUU7_9EURY|nr:hypothetical protein [Haloterrigena salina]ELZ14735.1 hypothetical protein C477_19624 [Haloterrigena salina JCM 13891]
MSPLAVALETAFAPLALAAVGPNWTTPLAASSVGAVVPRPFWLPLGTTIVALLVGVVLLAAASSVTRTVGDEIGERPDLSFAVGFLGLFGLLVVVTLPLILSMTVEHPAISALTAVVAGPGLFVWGLAVVVGSCLGAVAIGDRLARRRGDSASLVPAVGSGAVVLGASQLVPVFGALVAMGLATVAIGAVARLRFDVDERLFDGDAAGESAGRSEIGRSSAGWETEPDRSPAAVTWNGGDESAGQPADREDRSWPDGTEAVLERDGDDDSGRDEIDIVGDGENWTVGGWQWDADAADDGDGDAEPSREEPADER